MTLDKTFENEVKKIANGDGGRDYKFAFIDELKKISDHLNVGTFGLDIEKYGKAKVALCVAATIIENQHRYEAHQVQWAMLVMNLWTNKCERSISSAQINLHPCTLADCSSNLRRLTRNT